MPASLRLPWRPLELLDAEQLERIHLASLQILEEIGIDFQDPEALGLWQAAGADVDWGAQRVRLDRGLVLDLVAQAPRSFTWRARNPVHDVLLGPGVAAFGPCGGMAYVLDHTQTRRPGTLGDYEDLIRVAQASPALHFAAWEQVAALDVPLSARHLQRLRAALTLSDKPLMESAHGRIITADCLELCRLVFGDLEGQPPVIGDVINVSSPLRFDARMLGGLLTYARAGQVTYITPFILAGAMSPVTMAAALAQQNAEALAGVALTQLARPGAPVLMGGFTSNLDLRSGTPALGTPEGAWAVLAGAQLARRYGLPFRGNGGLTSSKTLDAQAAAETHWSLWPSLLGHSALIMHTAGWIDGGLTVSLDKFAFDLGQLEAFTTTLQGPAAPRAVRYPDSADWAARLATFEAPPMDPGLREAIDAFILRRSAELADVDLYA
ncbi:MAG: trimethylamine methyltransferase family protein [Anaerolineales bacterium]|nr:trimethylamine methyltransferase family protein [Anaerolineales bacterium]